MNLGPVEIGLIVLAVMLLFGYKKLPDASRSLGRSLRIFKGEVDGLRAEAADDAATVPPRSLPGSEAGVRSSASEASSSRAPAR